jgi:hypothetical protein
VSSRDPKFLPMDTADHTSNWFDKQHFEHNEFELCRLQPSTLDRIWISQHTQTNPVALAQEAGTLGILGESRILSNVFRPTRRPSASTLQEGSYTRKLKSSMKMIHGIGLLLLSCNSDSYPASEQNTVDLALLPSAKTPDGMCKEHYLELRSSLVSTTRSRDQPWRQVGAVHGDQRQVVRTTRNLVAYSGLDFNFDFDLDFVEQLSQDS